MKSLSYSVLTVGTLNGILVSVTLGKSITLLVFVMPEMSILSGPRCALMVYVYDCWRASCLRAYFTGVLALDLSFCWRAKDNVVVEPLSLFGLGMIVGC